MAYTYLLLGPVLFQDFELPPSIAWGGAQTLTVHKLPGGQRVIDAMGRDDTEISWTGVFSGSDAGLRARAIDLMRADGGLWPLTWETFFYSVVVSRFEADYRRPNWIPYRLTCTVLRDEAEAVVEAAVGISTSVLADLAAADGLGTGIDLTAATAANTASGATTLGSQAYAEARAQLAASLGAISGQLTSTGTQLAAATDPGLAVPLAGQAARLATAQGFLGRAATNLANASS
jgi:hypothetical protein